jgi:hypothetical protein
MCLIEWWSKRLAFLGFLAAVSGFFSCMFGRNGETQEWETIERGQGELKLVYACLKLERVTFIYIYIYIYIYI